MDFPESQRSDDLTKATQSKQKNDSESRRPIVLPYVKGISEKVAQVMKIGCLRLLQ